MLLVFQESCHFCEDNWKNWDKLFGASDSQIPVVFLSTDKTISDEYKSRHPLLTRKTVLLDPDSATLAALKPGITPANNFCV